jgi:predicted house-cleaning noncanonical NTP pyrophosphatase (MazG superfamily)
MKHNTYRCNKLCRDKTIDRVELAGGSCSWKTLTDIEHIKELGNKIQEEALEVADSKTRDELVLELADVLEVVDAIMHAHVISLHEVESAKILKKVERGGFIEKKFIETVTCPSDSVFAKYYSLNKDKYPLIQEEER